MPYQIALAPRAERELKALPQPARRKVDAKILSLAAQPRPAGCKKLQAKEELYRVRVGDYRIVYSVHDDVLLVLVLRIAQRGDAYRKLRRMRGK